MGRGLAWFTVETAELSDIATALDVKITGRRGSRKDFSLAARKLADGRWLVVSDNCDEPQFRSKYLVVISRLGKTWSGMLEEHVMASGFAAWGKGRKAWSILHQGDSDSLHLKTTGKLPKDIVALKDTAIEKQRREGDDAEGDYLYELSVDLVQPHTGLDPDVDFDDGEFEQLHIGFWRELWRRTFWWRLLFAFLAGFALFLFGGYWVARLMAWLVNLLGWR